MKKLTFLLFYLFFLFSTPSLAQFGSGEPFPANIIIRNNAVYLEGAGRIIDLRKNISATYDSISSTYHITGVTADSIANFPPSPSSGDLAVATNGASATDCTAGGGTTHNLCVYNGTAWTVVGDGTGGAGGAGNTFLTWEVPYGTDPVAESTIDSIEFLSVGSIQIWGSSTDDSITFILSADVVGPSSATDNAIARYDTTTGKLLQNSTPTVNDDGRIQNVSDAVDLSDAVNLDTLLEHTGISLHYWIGGGTLDLTLTDSEDTLLETPNANPTDELTTITFKSTVAETSTPFLIKAGTIIGIHSAAEVLATSGKYGEQYHFQLGYADDDGTDFVQIGSNSDLTDTLTTSKVLYINHIHVASDTTVPLGKILWLKVVADIDTGTGSDYSQITFYFDNSAYHMSFEVAGSVLGSFVKKTGDTMSGLLTLSGGLNVTGTATIDSIIAAGGTYTGVHNAGGATSFEIVNAANPTVDTPGEIALDITIGQLLMASNDSIAYAINFEKPKCTSVENLAAADDNMSLGSFGQPCVIKRAWCHYVGTGTTPATITLEDGASNSMTLSGTLNCYDGAAIPTEVLITAGGALVAKELLQFDVSNSPDPETDEYTVCVDGIWTRQ